MEESGNKEQGKKKSGPKVKTFSIPFDVLENTENITINTNIPSRPSKEELINQASI